MTRSVRVVAEVYREATGYDVSARTIRRDLKQLCAKEIGRDGGGCRRVPATGCRRPGHLDNRTSGQQRQATASARSGVPRRARVQMSRCPDGTPCRRRRRRWVRRAAGACRCGCRRAAARPAHPACLTSSFATGSAVRVLCLRAGDRDHAAGDCQTAVQPARTLPLDSLDSRARAEAMPVTCGRPACNMRNRTARKVAV